MQRLQDYLENFTRKLKKYKHLTLKNLMEPLSEIISINPSHSTDKLLSDKLFIKLFWQYWNIFSREEQQIMADNINKFFLKSMQQVQMQDAYKKFCFAKTFLEAVSSLQPQVRIEPEIL